MDCGVTSSCRPAGLEVTDISLPAQIGTNGLTGLRIADRLAVYYTVRNNGKTASKASPVAVTASEVSPSFYVDVIPPLDPGQSVTRSFQMLHERKFFGSGDDRFQVKVQLPPSEGSGDSLGSVYFSETYHFARPVLDIAVVPIEMSHVRVNDPLPMSIVVTNTSWTTRATNIELRHCLRASKLLCAAGNWTSFGVLPLPNLAPGESHVMNYTTAVTTTASGEDFREYTVLACVASRSDSSVYLEYEHFGTSVCFSGGELDVWPDFEACNPPVLSAQPATLREPNCGHYPVPPGDSYILDYRYKLHYLYALDAVAGRVYEVTGTEAPVFVDHTGRPIVDADPEDARVSFPATGRYYLKVRDWRGVRRVSVQTLSL